MSTPPNVLPCPICKGVPARPEIAECHGGLCCDFTGTRDGYEQAERMKEDAFEAAPYATEDAIAAAKLAHDQRYPRNGFEDEDYPTNLAGFTAGFIEGAKWANATHAPAVRDEGDAKWLARLEMLAQMAGLVIRGDRLVEAIDGRIKYKARALADKGREMGGEGR